MKITPILTITSLYLGIHLLLNPTLTLAESTTPPPTDKVQQPPSKETPPAQPSSTNNQTVDKATPAKKPPAPVINNPALEKAVGGYIEAWQKKDYKTMYTYESWEGGETLDDIGYIKALDTNFTIHTWQITKVQPLNEQGDEFKVLVLVTHNPPTEIAAMVPAGQTVRSTLNQWWRKQGDKFVHQFNIERKTLLQQTDTMKKSLPSALSKDNSSSPPPPAAKEPKE